MYLIFDTETTGFPVKGQPREHPAQARLVQVGWVVLDVNFREISCFKSLIQLPSGKLIADGARAAHGINEADCHRYGIPAKPVMDVYNELWLKSKKVVAHNLNFDRQLIDIENEDTLGLDWSDQKCVCTMHLMTPVCKIEQLTRAGYKWPKLQEAYQYLFKEEFKGAHDALSDVRATARIFQWLVENKHIEV